jgi:hypothetical protein
MYGVGDRGGIYTISTRTAKAMKVSQLTVASAVAHMLGHHASGKLAITVE